MGRRKKLDSEVESLDMCEFEDEGFSEGEINVGKAVACFNFAIGNAETNPIINKPAAFIKTVQTYKTTNRGLTPAVDGELYTVKRCYQFRQSTIRKLNELKAEKRLSVNASPYKSHLYMLLS